MLSEQLYNVTAVLLSLSPSPWSHLHFYLAHSDLLGIPAKVLLHIGVLNAFLYDGIAFSLFTLLDSCHSSFKISPVF